MALSVYTGVCAPIVKFDGSVDVAPGFAKRIVVVADSSSQALKKMANYFRTFKFPPISTEGEGEKLTPTYEGMEVFTFEVSHTDGAEDGRVVVLG